MCPKINRRVFYLFSALALGAFVGWSPPSDAAIQQLVIDQTATVNFTPIIPGTSTPGASTSYTIYQGRAFGLLDPSNPDNAVITDMALRRPSPAGFSTSPISRSSRRPVRQRVTD